MKQFNLFDFNENYNIRLIFKGDNYGLNNKLTHKKGDPLVEFWTVRDNPYFVSRYCASTLMEGEPKGLMLDGGQPELTISTENMIKVRRFIRQYTTGSYTDSELLHALNRTIRDLYLEYVNDYLTVKKFASDKGLSIAGAESIIDRGRELHEKNVVRNQYHESQA